MVSGLNSVSSERLNPFTGRMEKVPGAPLTAAAISEFQTYGLVKTKNEYYQAIKPMLAKGGFIFDSSLWKWEFIKVSPQKLTLWVTITFVDDLPEGKTLFMDAIKQTGIMDYDFVIVKPYS